MSKSEYTYLVDEYVKGFRVLYANAAIFNIKNTNDMKIIYELGKKQFSSNFNSTYLSDHHEKQKAYDEAFDIFQKSIK